MISRIEILSLYKVLLRESQKIPAYNFRKFALRKIQDSFKVNKNVADASVIEAGYFEAQRNLEVIKRQAIIGQLYSTEKLVIENIVKK